MANHKSAAKRAKQSLKKLSTNKVKKSRARNVVKSLNAAILADDKEKGLKLLRSAQSLLNRASKTNAFSKKSAARKTSRLARQLNKMEAK